MVILSFGVMDYMSQILADPEERCPKCNGNGMLPIAGGTADEECTCKVRLRISRYAGRFTDFAFLASTKLLAILREGTNLCIECPNDKIIGAHIKTALIRSRDVNRTWRSMWPDEVVSAYYGGESVVKTQLFTTDLLIIYGAAWPIFEKSFIAYEYIIATRTAANRPTWIIMRSRKDLVESKQHEITDSFSRLLKDMPVMKLSASDTVVQRRSSEKPTVNTAHGLGISGINKGLMVFHPELDSRIRLLKEKVNGVRELSISDNGDDT